MSGMIGKHADIARRDALTRPCRPFATPGIGIDDLLKKDYLQAAICSGALQLSAGAGRGRITCRAC